MLAHPQQTLPARHRVRKVLAPVIAEAAALPGVDRYRKKFTTEAHLWTLVFHALEGHGSLRQTYASLAAQPELWQQWGLESWISLSQLARSSSSRPVEPFALLARQLMQMAGDRLQSSAGHAPATWLSVLDSTFLPLSAVRSPWSQHGQSAAGMRLQLMLGVPTAFPEGEVVLDLDLTGTEVNDHQALAQWDLTDLAGTTVLIDLGYYGHRNLVLLREAGVDFIMPTHPQASIMVLADLPGSVPRWLSDDGQLVADQQIQLGSPNNRRGATLAPLRQVTMHTPSGFQSFITSRFDLDPAQIIDTYRRRWRIELFFRWIKHELGLLPAIGTSPQALWITVLIAIIVHAISVLLRDLRPPNMSRIAWMRFLARSLRMDHPVPGG